MKETKEVIFDFIDSASHLQLLELERRIFKAKEKHIPLLPKENWWREDPCGSEIEEP